MKLLNREFLGDFVGFHNAKVGDHRDWSFAGKAETFALVTAAEMADRSDEIQLLHKRASGLFEHENDFVRAAGDFGGAACARQSSSRSFIIANDGGVDVGKAVDLRSAEETDIDTAALQPV